MLGEGNDQRPQALSGAMFRVSLSKCLHLNIFSAAIFQPNFLQPHPKPI
jgi:hypothetical protein